MAWDSESHPKTLTLKIDVSKSFQTLWKCHLTSENELQVADKRHDALLCSLHYGCWWLLGHLQAQWWPNKDLTHWGLATHICVGKLTIIGSDNGLSPGRRQAIIWTNVGILLIGPLRTDFSEILIENQTFSFKKMHLKMLSAKWRPFCLGLNVLSTCPSELT